MMMSTLSPRSALYRHRWQPLAGLGSRQSAFRCYSARWMFGSDGSVQPFAPIL